MRSLVLFVVRHRQCPVPGVPELAAFVAQAVDTLLGHPSTDAVMALFRCIFEPQLQPGVRRLDTVQWFTRLRAFAMADQVFNVHVVNKSAIHLIYCARSVAAKKKKKIIT